MDFQKIISEMTLEEKLGMIHGDNVYDTQGVERLEIPLPHRSGGYLESHDGL